MQKTTRKGFTLIEMMLYVLFIAFIAMATASLMVHLWQSLYTRNQKQELLITLYLAHDMLVRDLHDAPVDPLLWKEIQHDTLIWHTKKGDIGWQRKQKQLVRKEGRYNAQKHRWSKVTISLIANQVTQVSFTCTRKPEIDCISFIITADTLEVKGAVAPSGRRLLWGENANKKERS